MCPTEHTNILLQIFYVVYEDIQTDGARVVVIGRSPKEAKPLVLD